MVTTLSDIGWLPYGSDDSSILAQADLKSVTSITDLSASLSATGSGVSFDDDGMNTNGTGGYKITDLVGFADLDFSGQISIDIPRFWVCYDDASAHTTGLVPGSNQVAIGLGSDQVISKTTSETVNSLLNGAQTTKEYTDGVYNGAQSIPCAVNSGGRDDYVRVQLGWLGGRTWLAFDDYIFAAGQMTGRPSNDFQNIYIGSIDGTNNYMDGNYPIRNLLISTKPPMFPIHHKLRKVSVLSDSSFKQDLPNGSFRDGVTSQYIRGGLARRGFRCGEMSVDVNGSHTIADTATNDLSDRITALTNENPQVVILSAGTNDVVTGALAMDDTWDTSLKSLLTSILAISTVELVVVRTIPSLMGDSSQNTAANRARKVIANDYIKLLPSWNSSVAVADVDKYFGEEDTPTSYFIGSDNENYDDFHLTPKGHKKHAESLTDAILNNI